MIFRCPRCGREHVIEADYFVPGVEGTIMDKIFVDPTVDRHCPECVVELIKELMQDQKGVKNEN